MSQQSLFQKFYSAINAMRQKTSKQAGIQYIKVSSIEEIKDVPKLDYHDLSELDLREYKDLFDYAPTESMPRSGIRGWTTNVIWPSPDKMPDGFNPMEIMERAKRPNTNAGATGRGINVAVIDNMLDTTNPEFADRIKHFEGPVDGSEVRTNWHASMVVGHIAGRHTGMAPDANIYFFTKRTYQDRKKFGQEICKVLQNVIRFNNAQTPENKIHILSCSWGVRKKYHHPQIFELFDQLEKSGVKIILCGTDDMALNYTVSPRDFMPCNNPNMTDVQSNVQTAGQEYLDSWNIKYTPDKIVGIPTNMRTTPMGADGWQYNITGGESSAAPYIAGVYAAALSGNQLFMTRPDWQSELNDILKSTATQTPDGNYMINPSGIRGRVSEIVKQMEMDLIKQRATKWSISKSGRTAKSTATIKQKFTRAIQSIDNALTTAQMAVKRQLPNKTKATAHVNSFDDIDTITKKIDDLTKKRDMQFQQIKEMQAKYNLDHDELYKQNPEYKQLFYDLNQTTKQIIQMRKSHPELWKPGEDVIMYMDIDNLNKKLDETEAEYKSYLSELESKEKELTTKLESIPKQTTEQQKAAQMAKTRWGRALDEKTKKLVPQFDEALEARDKYQSAFLDEYYDKHGSFDGWIEAMKQTEEYKRLQNDVEFWGEKYISTQQQLDSSDEELNSLSSNWIEAETAFNPEYVTVSNELEYVKALKDDAIKTVGDIRNVTFWEAIPQEIKNKLPKIRDEEIVEILASDDELTWFVNNFDKVESDPNMYSKFLRKLEEGLNSRHQFSKPVRLEAHTGQELNDKYGLNNFINGSNGVHIGKENVAALNTEREDYKGLDGTIALIKHEVGHSIDSHAPNDGIIGETLSKKILPSHGNADMNNRIIEAVSPSGTHSFSVSDITQEQMDQLISEGWSFISVADKDNYDLYRKELTEQSSWSVETTKNIKDKVNAYRE